MSWKEGAEIGKIGEAAVLEQLKNGFRDTKDNYTPEYLIVADAAIEDGQHATTKRLQDRGADIVELSREADGTPRITYHEVKTDNCIVGKFSGNKWRQNRQNALRNR